MAGHQGSSCGEGRAGGQRSPPGSRWHLFCLWRFPSELLCLSRPHVNRPPLVSPPRGGPGVHGLLHPQTPAGHRGAPALWGSRSCLPLLRWAHPDLVQFLCCDCVCYLGISQIGFNFSVSSMVVRMASILPFVGDLGWTLLCTGHPAFPCLGPCLLVPCPLGGFPGLLPVDVPASSAVDSEVPLWLSRLTGMALWR